MANPKKKKSAPNFKELEKAKKNTKKSKAKVEAKQSSFKEKAKTKTKKATQKTKEIAKKGKEKLKEVQKSSTWKKIKNVAKKAAQITGSHLAALRTSITLSNEESKLMTKLKNDLNKQGIYPSKSEILRAGFWNLRKMNTKQLEKVLQDLMKIKKIRVL